MLVKNVIGSSRFVKPRGYASWLDYWKAITGKNPHFCSASGCIKTDLVGAHIVSIKNGI